MARPLESGGPDRPPGRLSPQLAAVLRPELDSLAEDIMAEIRKTIPAYAPTPEKGERPQLRMSVDQALRTFVDRISGSDESRERRDQLCRGLGRGEAYRGRSLDSLQAAYRAGVQVAWRRVAEVGRRHQLSSAVMSQLAGALFDYIDELASLSVEGFEEARSRGNDSRAEARRRLAVLSGMGDVRRRRLIETLCAWLESEGNAVETAGRLRVHPQTVRYRLKQITDAFGDHLTDPDSRFALEAVLRAERLRDRGHPQNRPPARSPDVSRR